MSASGHPCSPDLSLLNKSCPCMQEYQRRYNLEPLVKPVSKEEEFVEQQGRTRATVRPDPPQHVTCRSMWQRLAVHVTACCVTCKPCIAL